MIQFYLSKLEYENKKCKISRDRPCYFLLTCYFQQWTFFPILPVAMLLMFDTFRRKWQSSQVKWNKKGLGNFDGLEQKPKESNVTLITSYPSKDSLCNIASFVHLQQIDLQIFTFRLNPKRSRDESFQISQNGWCGLFLRFMLHSHFFFSKHHHQASFEVLRNRRLQSIFIKQVGWGDQILHLQPES